MNKKVVRPAGLAPRLVGAPVDPPQPEKKSASAIRAAKWRAKQDSEFKKKEAQRKREERAEFEHQQQLKELLDSGKFPVSLESLRHAVGGKWFVKDAPKGQGLIVTGGYSTLSETELDLADAEHQRQHGGKSTFTPPAKATKPPGYGADDVVLTPEKFVPVHYVAPREVRIMQNVIRQRFDEKPMMKCWMDGKQVAPYWSFAAGFNHLYNEHPEVFQQMVNWIHESLLKRQRRCTEDHAHMLQTFQDRQAQRGRPLTERGYCGRCGKWLNRPDKRSDTAEEPSKITQVTDVAEVNPI